MIIASGQVQYRSVLGCFLHFTLPSFWGNYPVFFGVYERFQSNGILHSICDLLQACFATQCNLNEKWKHDFNYIRDNVIDTMIMHILAYWDAGPSYQALGTILAQYPAGKLVELWSLQHTQALSCQSSTVSIPAAESGEEASAQADRWSRCRNNRFPCNMNCVTNK